MVSNDMKAKIRGENMSEVNLFIDKHDSLEYLASDVFDSRK